MDIVLDATHFGQVDDGCDGAHGVMPGTEVARFDQ